LLFQAWKLPLNVLNIAFVGGVEGLIHQHGKKHHCRAGTLFQAEERKILPGWIRNQQWVFLGSGRRNFKELPLLTVLLYIHELLITSNSWQTTFPIFCTSKKKRLKVKMK
jgi:hypothetical protein